jgi:PAS domain S-box-containing protein
LCKNSLYTDLPTIFREYAVFKTVLYTTPNHVFYQDREGRFKFVTPAIARLYDLSQEEMVGKAWRELGLPALAWEPLDDPRKKVIVTGQELRSETSSPITGRYYEYRIIPVLVEGGEVEGTVTTMVDITERKQADEELRRKTEELDRYFTNSLDLLCIADTDGCFRRLNLEWEKTLGYSLEELQGMRFLDLVHPDDLEKTEDAVAQLSSQITVLNFVNRYRRKDGSYRWIEWRSYPEGKLIYAVARDITERKRAERQLNSELRRAIGLYELYSKSLSLPNRALYDLALDLAVQVTESTIGFLHLVSEDGNDIILTTWNQETRKTCTTASEGHYPIDQAGNWVDCVKLKRPVVYNDFPISPNQKGLPVGHSPVKRFLSVPVIENSKVRIIFGVGNKTEEYDDRDVVQIQLVANELHKIVKLRRIENEIRDREAFLRGIMDNATEAIFVKDLEGRMAMANPAYFRMFGHTPEEVLGKRVADYYPLELASQLEAYEQSVILSGAVTSLELDFQTPERGWRDLQVTMAPYRDSEGRIIGYLGVARDITDLVEAEQNVEKAKSRAELYLELLTHDITNYNTAAMGYLELAQMRLSLEDKDKKLIARPLQVLKNSSELIANVRDLQRVEKGQDRKEQIDLCRMLREVKEAFENPPGKDVTFVLDLQGSCSVVASGLMRDAFANIVNNAINHSIGPVTITISLKKEKQQGADLTRISIEDDGPGIADDRKEKIFDRALMGLTKGVSRGLGLYLVKRLVEEQGGKVWVEDRVPGDHTKGAKFVITMPVVTTSEAPSRIED